MEKNKLTVQAQFELQVEEVKRELETLKVLLLKHLNIFTQDEANIKPPGGGWSAGQVGQHLVKSFGGVPDLLKGRAQATDRDPAAKIGMIKSDFLDFSNKMKSPDFIIPEDRIYNIIELETSLRNILEAIQEASRQLDLSATCLEFEFPVYGYLTRLEWIVFVICHGLRHSYQLEKIYGSIMD